MQRWRTLLIVVILLLLLLLLWLWWGWHKRSATPKPPVAVPPPVIAPVVPVIHLAPVTRPPPAPHPAPVLPVVPSTSTTPTPSTSTLTIPVKPPPVTMVVPGQEGMHSELIPKDITIVRCYYDDDIVAPGETFGFDINGSGFTESFQEMISVTIDGLDLQVENLRLVTANEIHGQIQVGPEATTQYNYPVVVIHNLPVFKAPDPFGMVRPGEVLDVVLTSIDDSGQFGKFQVITNLNDRQFAQIHVIPTTPALQVSDLKPLLPFRINGAISIAPGLSSGQYGLSVTSNGHELFRKDPLVDVVRPDVGKTGSIETVKAVDAAHRPGDTLVVKMTGSGFSPTESNNLTARVDTFATEAASFSWVSEGHIDISLPLPNTISEGLYGMTIFDKGKQVFQKKTVFGIVPENWLSGVFLTEPLSPGKMGTVQLRGRAISQDYARTIQVETDEPGLAISNIHWIDFSTVGIDIQVAPTVAPGDYLLHVGSAGVPIKLPLGNIIKVAS